MAELNLEQIFWEKLTQNEKRAYVLFSIPVWFDDLLSHALLNKLNSVKKLDYDKIKQNFTMVYRYEAKGFCYDNKVRKFLIKRIEEFFQIDEVKEINAFLKQHYLTKSKNATTPYRQKESLYLSYYHGIQENPDEGFRMIFNEFLNHTDAAMQLPMINSLINICNLPPRRTKKNPYYTYLKHQACFLKDGENKKEIKNSFGDLFEISKLLSSGKDRNLKLYILNLLLKLNEVLPSKKMKKNKKKILKQINALKDQNNLDLDDGSTIESKQNSYFQFKEATKTIKKIIRFHLAGQHEDAQRELTYLENLQIKQKDQLCKSYCNVATGLKSNYTMLEWQGKYLDKAISCNKFDAVALNSKAELLAKIGKTDEALAYFDKAHEVNPHDEVCVNGKAELLAKIGKTDEAFAYFDKSHKINPYDVVCLNARANLIFEQGDLNRAISEYRIIHSAIGKDCSYTKCSLAFLLLKQDLSEQNINEAISLFEEAVKIPDSISIASLGLWISYSRIGEIRKAQFYKDQFEKFADQFDSSLYSEIEIKFKEVKNDIDTINVQDIAKFQIILTVIIGYAQHLIRKQLMMQYHQFA